MSWSLVLARNLERFMVTRWEPNGEVFYYYYAYLFVVGAMGVWRDGCLARWVFGPMFCIPFLFEIEPDEILVLERERAEDAIV
jgi:hypothetical protein